MEQLHDTEDSDSDEDIILYYIWRKKIKSSRSMWIREIFLDRSVKGEFHHLYPQLLLDGEKFHSYFRMSENSFNLLLNKIREIYVLGESNFRTTISIEERLTVTLRYLATGESYRSMSFRFRISHNCICSIINTMLDKIYEVLHSKYLKFPNKDEFKIIAHDFKTKKKFPNCIGAIDGKHIRIRKPINCGSLYYNYKQFHSIVLLAIVDANYNFLMIDVGSYGKNSDGGVFDHSNFGRLFNTGQLNLPEDEPVEDNGEPLPYVFIGDEAFRLNKHLLKPFPRRDLDDIKRTFNYRLSYARQQVECAFGILSSKFRIFDTPIAIHPDKIDKIIRACCALHNMIRIEEHIPDDPEQTNISSNAFGPISEINALDSRRNNASGKEAKLIREKYAAYFFSNAETS